MELFDPVYDIYWLKYPLLKKMMADRRDVEWFLWMDTDTLITDFAFDIPFDKYQGFDLVFSGKDQKVGSLPLYFYER
jgi:xyloglucan 6-xylosyltransferase